MRRYYYQMFDMWLNCRAKSKAQVMDMLEGQADVILTEREAEKRAEHDEELAEYMRCAYMCDLMCN